MNTTKNKVRTKTRGRVKSTSIFWLPAAIKRVANDAHDYAVMDSAIQVWIKAFTKDNAIALTKQRLVVEGWQLKKVYLVTKVDPGFARIISMMDPLAFSDDEADKWTEQYWIAEAEGFSCSFAHSGKAKR